MNIILPPTTNANGLPTVDRPCPPWCAEHIPDTDQCVSPALDAAVSCATWLVQERGDAEPTVTIDTAPSGAILTIDQADELSDAIQALLRAVREGSPVQWTPAEPVQR